MSEDILGASDDLEDIKESEDIEDISEEIKKKPKKKQKMFNPVSGYHLKAEIKN